MNIFDKLNNSMNALTGTINNLSINSNQLNDINFTKNNFSVTIKLTSVNSVDFKYYTSVVITQLENKDHATFDNDKNDSCYNLTARYFFTECRDNFVNYEKYNNELFDILNDILKTLDRKTIELLQTEKAFLSVFLTE